MWKRLKKRAYEVFPFWKFVEAIGIFGFLTILIIALLIYAVVRLFTLA